MRTLCYPFSANSGDSARWLHHRLVVVRRPRPRRYSPPPTPVCVCPPLPLPHRRAGAHRKASEWLFLRERRFSPVGHAAAIQSGSSRTDCTSASPPKLFSQTPKRSPSPDPPQPERRAFSVSAQSAQQVRSISSPPAPTIRARPTLVVDGRRRGVASCYSCSSVLSD